jgi:hypothetical protein
VRCPLSEGRVAFLRSYFVELRRGTLRCRQCNALLRHSGRFRRGRTKAFVLYLVAFVTAECVLEAVPPVPWQGPVGWVLWLLGMYWLGTR